MLPSTSTTRASQSSSRAPRVPGEPSSLLEVFSVSSKIEYSFSTVGIVASKSDRPRQMPVVGPPEKMDPVMISVALPPFATIVRRPLPV